LSARDYSLAKSHPPGAAALRGAARRARDEFVARGRSGV